LSSDWIIVETSLLVTSVFKRIQGQNDTEEKLLQLQSHEVILHDVTWYWPTFRI